MTRDASKVELVSELYRAFKSLGARGDLLQIVGDAADEEELIGQLHDWNNRVTKEPPTDASVISMTAHISPDQRQTVLHFAEPPPGFNLTLTAGALERLIESLAQVRTRLQPPIARA